MDNTSCKLSQWVGRQEFVVPSNVLGLVYGQTVVWTGALFCPLLPLLNTAKFVILFYCKKVNLQLYHSQHLTQSFIVCSLTPLTSRHRSHFSTTVVQH